MFCQLLCELQQRRVSDSLPTFLQSSHTTELTPGEPSCSPHSKQRDIPSPHTVFFMSSRRFIKRLQQHRVRSYLKCHRSLSQVQNICMQSVSAGDFVFICTHFGETTACFTISHPILSCSMASIFSARAITLFIISFSSSVKSGPGPGPGCMVQLPLSAKHILQLRLHCFCDFTK